MADISARNRRIHSRRATRIPARLSRDSDSVEGTIENIGEGGVFFATQILEIDLDEGSPALVSFRCTKDGAPVTMELSGTVLRTERYFDGEAVVRAFALKFDELIDLNAFEFE